MIFGVTLMAMLPLGQKLKVAPFEPCLVILICNMNSHCDKRTVSIEDSSSLEGHLLPVITHFPFLRFQNSSLEILCFSEYLVAHIL